MFGRWRAKYGIIVEEDAQPMNRVSRGLDMPDEVRYSCYEKMKNAATDFRREQEGG